MSLEAIKFDRTDRYNVSVEVLNQLLLPYVTSYNPVYTIDDGYTLIKSMRVRGAPAIAIVGLLSVLMECQLLSNKSFAKSQGYYDVNDYKCFKNTLDGRLEFLLGSRPTAVNLSNTIKEVRQLSDSPDCDTFSKFHDRLYDYACEMIDSDLKNNMIMGDHGASYLLNTLKTEGFNDDFGVITICNTGSLATAGYGTALGAIRSLWKDSQAKTPTGNPSKKPKSALHTCKAKMVHVYPLETRPFNQGSRLTAYELKNDGIPSTLITDSSIAYKVTTSKLPIKAAFVGADRIVRNGDTANKIGTLQLAMLCRQMGIKLIVVAPTYTIDGSTSTGKDIVVEERDPNEFRLVTGTFVDTTTGAPLLADGVPITGKVGITPPGMSVWNPSFDVTPHELIDAIITEKGTLLKDENGEFNMQEVL